jgi:hypothetical protein
MQSPQQRNVPAKEQKVRENIDGVWLSGKSGGE